MAYNYNHKNTFLKVFPNCPYYGSVIEWSLMLAQIALGTIGIYLLNLWIAIAYLIFSSWFYFMAMPIWHCKYCYFRISGITKDQWKDSYLIKHVANGKKWGFNFLIIWFLPIILIIISIFINFSIYALFVLIGFVGLLVLFIVYMMRRVCPTCEIVEECHKSF